MKSTFLSRCTTWILVKHKHKCTIYNINYSFYTAIFYLQIFLPLCHVMLYNVHYERLLVESCAGII